MNIHGKYTLGWRLNTTTTVSWKYAPVLLRKNSYDLSNAIVFGLFAHALKNAVTLLGILADTRLSNRGYHLIW